MQLFVRPCIAFRCKKCMGFELPGTWGVVSLPEVHGGDISLFPVYSITLGKQLPFSVPWQSKRAWEGKALLAAAVSITQRYRCHLLRCHLLSPAALGGQWSVSGCEKVLEEICVRLDSKCSLNIHCSSGKEWWAEGKFITQTGIHWLKMCHSE